MWDISYFCCQCEFSCLSNHFITFILLNLWYHLVVSWVAVNEPPCGSKCHELSDYHAEGASTSHAKICLARGSFAGCWITRKWKLQEGISHQGGGHKKTREILYFLFLFLSIQLWLCKTLSFVFSMQGRGCSGGSSPSSHFYFVCLINLEKTYF